MDIFSPKPMGKPPVYPRIRPPPKVAPAPAALPGSAALGIAPRLVRTNDPFGMFSPPPAVPKGTTAPVPSAPPAEMWVAPRYNSAPNMRSFFPANNRGFPGNGKTLRRRAPPKKMEELGAVPVHPNRALVPPTARPTVRVNTRRGRKGRKSRKMR